MSCLAQGCGLETFALQEVARIARGRGCQTLHGRIRETPRNEPIHDLYSLHSFACTREMEGASTWMRQITGR
jgi:predicted enzyme involved in methoxymalonyl-ACP biosynthesis